MGCCNTIVTDIVKELEDFKCIPFSERFTQYIFNQETKEVYVSIGGGLPIFFGYGERVGDTIHVTFTKSITE